MKKSSNYRVVYVKPNSFGRALASLFGFLVVSVVAGALVASTTLPAIWLMNKTSDEVTSVLDGFPDELEINDLMEKSNIYAMDSAGKPVLLASFFEQDREKVASDAVSQYIKDATVAAEDPRFYEHGGIDIRGVFRAFVSNSVGNDVQGGSSITQQFVKNTLVQEAEALTDSEARDDAYDEATETTLNRKIREMKLAIELEKKYTKDEILMGYLNIVGFGDRIYGIEAASNYYYGVSAKDVTLSQAATLMAIVNRPNAFRIDQPDNVDNGAANGYQETLDRRDYVLSSMLEHGKITQEEYDVAYAEPITPVITQPSTGCQTAGGAAYFCDYVTKVILNDPIFGKTAEERSDLLKRGGLQIYTTLDLDLQAATENSINQWVPKTVAEADFGATSVSIEPGTGRILAMGQNKDYTNDPAVAATGGNYTSINYNTDEVHGGSTGFQTGSTYKLFTLIEWLKTGHSVYDRVSGHGTYTHFTNTCEGDWYGRQTFKNDDGSYSSYGSALRATVNSLNTGFLSMAEQMDLCAIRNDAISMGVYRADGETLQSNPTSVIGTNEIAPLQMASGYATVAAGGVACNPIAISKIINGEGEELPIPESTCTRVFEEGVAGAAAEALQATYDYGTASPANIGDGIPIIGKTGTTDDSLHTWMIGSSTRVTTVVWTGNVVGFVNLRTFYLPSGQQASQVRYRIWEGVMAVADSKYGGAEFPAGAENLVN